MLMSEVPETLDVGDCLVGGVKVARFTVTNLGGHGRFVLMATDCWPCSSAMVSQSVPSKQRCTQNIPDIIDCNLKKNYPIFGANIFHTAGHQITYFQLISLKEPITKIFVTIPTL